MNNYLDQFPEEHRQFVYNRFSQAYVFAAQTFEFGEDDDVDFAVGPLAMKARVVAACEEMLDLVNAEHAAVLNQIISTIGDSDDFLKEVKTRVDDIRRKSNEYREAHPPKEKKKKKGEPATEKQLGFLKKLGCKEIPETKYEATQLIDKYKRKQC